MTLTHHETSVRLYFNLAHFEGVTILPHLDDIRPRMTLTIPPHEGTHITKIELQGRTNIIITLI